MFLTLLAASCSLATSTASASAADEPLSVTMKVWKVTQNAAGEETLAPADAAKPGDLLEYVATYENVSDRALRQVTPTVPVPPGMTIVMESALPVAAQLTEDGRAYRAIPADPAQRPHAAAIRGLRWAPVDLASGATCAVSLRVRLQTSGDASPAPAP